MLAYGFDSFALDGALAFAGRNGRVVAEVSPEGCAVVGREPVVALTRAPAAETAARVAVGFVRADMDYVPGAVEAVAPDQAEPNAAQTAVSIVFAEGQARGIAERWLSEGRVARDGAAFALPPSSLAVTAGDIVALGSDLYRVDRVEEAGHRAISAVRIEPGIYAAPVFEVPVNRAPVIAAPTPVHVEFLDLPLLRGDEVPHAPHVAVARTPWAGPVAVYSANADFGYALNCELLRPAVFGETLDALPRGAPGLWMRVSVRVRIGAGSLQSRSEADVLNGANVAAVRSSGDWEVIQFRDAVLVGPREYELSGLLRGQAGTDGVMPDVWPAGSDFVLLDGSAPQVSLPASARGLERHYRVGPAVRAYDDPSYVHRVEAFAGVGLRPYRPAHLRAGRRADGGIGLAWIRRTRIDGDSWQGGEVPLGEEREAYVVRVVGAGALLREVEVGAPSHVYAAAEQAADGAPAALVFEVAQVSDRFGPGPFERIEFDG
jgi:hypothetical protein